MTLSSNPLMAGGGGPTLTGGALLVDLAGQLTPPSATEWAMMRGALQKALAEEGGVAPGAAVPVGAASLRRIKTAHAPTPSPEEVVPVAAVAAVAAVVPVVAAEPAPGQAKLTKKKSSRRRPLKAGWEKCEDGTGDVWYSNGTETSWTPVYEEGVA